MDINPEKNKTFLKRSLVFGLFILIYAVFLFFTDSDLRDPTGYKWIIFGVVIALVLAIFMLILNKKRPDIFKKWFSGSKFVERLSQNTNENDLKFVSTEFAHWYLDSSILGIVAGIIVVVCMFGFVWYAKTYLGW